MDVTYSPVNRESGSEEEEAPGMAWDEAGPSLSPFVEDFLGKPTLPMEDEVWRPDPGEAVNVLNPGKSVHASMPGVITRMEKDLSGCHFEVIITTTFTFISYRADHLLVGSI
jgi:hypothetical protein